MKRGPGGGPPDRDNEAFDPVWGELLREGGKHAGDTPDGGASDGGASGGGPSDGGPDVPARPPAADAEQTRKVREVETLDQMDWLMTVSPAASGFGKIIDPGDGAADDDADPDAKTRPDIVAPSVAGKTASPAVRRTFSESDDNLADAALRAHGAAANERPVPRAPEPARSNAALWIGGLAVVGVVAIVAMRRDRSDDPVEPKAAATTQRAASAQVGAEHEPREPTHEPSVYTDVAHPSGARAVPPPAFGSTGAAEVDVEPDGDPQPGDPADDPAGDASADLREPPPGTPPEVAAIFRKLPISPADGAPVGGVGASGVHVDDIAMGAVYDDTRCSGESKRFSLSAGDRPSVCVRVVHQREKEDLVVQWEKQGGATRRGQLHIPAIHAYRTRAYLMLRQEYVGDWTVKVLSQDGIELAMYAFSVVP